MQTRIKTVGVVGAGAMGRGIAQIATQAGCQVRLFDMQPAAVAAARDHVLSQWDKLQEKGRLDAATVAGCRERLQGVDSLEALAGCDLVIEAIVERLDAKRQLFAALEGILGPDAILASNTSSLSVTAIGAGVQRPQRPDRVISPSAPPRLVLPYCPQQVFAHRCRCTVCGRCGAARFTDLRIDAAQGELRSAAMALEEAAAALADRIEARAVTAGALAAEAIAATQRLYALSSILALALSLAVMWFYVRGNLRLPPSSRKAATRSRGWRGR